MIMYKNKFCKITKEDNDDYYELQSLKGKYEPQRYLSLYLLCQGSGLDYARVIGTKESM